MEITCKYDKGQKGRPAVHSTFFIEPVVKNCVDCLAPLCVWCGKEEKDEIYCNECNPITEASLSVSPK